MEIMLSTNSTVEKYLGMAIENEAPFNYNGTQFINIHFLYNFIKDNLKADYVNFEDVLKEVISEAGNCETYELGSFETKSGNPETISFKYTYELNEDDDLVSDTIEFE